MIKYKKGYKYLLAEHCYLDTNILLPVDIRRVGNDFVTLVQAGRLYIRKGYAWDGCSGIAYDTNSNMEAGLAHDALYQLMRDGLLDISYRDFADKLLKEVMIKNDALKIRASYYYQAVKIGAKKYATKAGEPKVLSVGKCFQIGGNRG